MVDEFDVKEDFAGNSVIGVPDLAEVNKGVDGGEESTVEPSSSLGYEFRDGILGELVHFLLDIWGCWTYQAHQFHQYIP